MAAVVRLKPYHFAKHFKRATGLPPHEYVIARRVEQAKQLLQGGDFTLAQVAARAGFSNQRVFNQHIKRLVGVTPGRFRPPARICYRAASSSKKPAGEPLNIPINKAGRLNKVGRRSRADGGGRLSGPTLLRRRHAANGDT
jgi:AraC-like DNA-binding protein